MLEIDGSYGEGGGAIIRNCLALAALTGTPFKINDIRKNRPDQGLNAQHLASVLAVQQLCNAEVRHAQLGSTQLEFVPGKIEPRTVAQDIGTAGSITLLLQALLLPCLFAQGKMRIKIRGGTDTKWSIPFDYFSHVFLPHVQRYADVKVELLQRGYYPKGGGRIDLKITPSFKLDDSFDRLRHLIATQSPKISLLEPGKLVGIGGISHASDELEKAEVAERQAKAARHALRSLVCPVKIDTEYVDTPSAGSGICLWARFDSGAVVGGDALGEQGKRSEVVGEEAASNLLKEVSAKVPVDRFLADQLVPFIALFGGELRTSEISMHTLTNIYVAEKFLGSCISVDQGTKVVRG